ncbi:GDNF family receptor alpha-like [Thalassophryne amazonica]|uniref:GDNF family receptor alpha-like n=1 Tax=Thalassophryne amazonica TaxID=390379 RepID=UPI001471343F|nr:GDNF family receptor alpha-like [Thalassophryne amazonica]
MQAKHLDAVVILGIVFSQISDMQISSEPSGCLAVLVACVSDLCRSEEAFYSGTCGVNDRACRLKGSTVCNMTIQAVLNQYPSLHGCVCTWEEELCDSLQALATQCLQKTGQQKTGAAMDWKSSSLTGYAYDGAGSCLEQTQVCIGDVVCNRHLAVVLQACTPELCDSRRCQHATQMFYGSMPHNVAEMLLMCDCDTLDNNCMQAKSVLHGGTCGEKTTFCQETVNRCVGDSYCRNLLKTFRAKCWAPEDVQCDDSDLEYHACLTQMDPAGLLSHDYDCKMSFLAAVGTALLQPCTCKGLHSNDLRKCNMLYDVLHNRSHFRTLWKNSSGPSIPHTTNKSEQTHSWLTGNYPFDSCTVQLLISMSKYVMRWGWQSMVTV